MTTTPPLPPQRLSPSKKSGENRPDSLILPPRLQANSQSTAAFDQMAIDSEAAQVGRPATKTPEPQIHQDLANGQKGYVAQSPSTPGHLPPFDWDDFETRYEQALAEANDQERELLAEFEELVKYFNVWASAASAHDHERATKRLQTRERFVKIAESSLAQKKKHLSEVVRAFQSALALLSQS